MIQNLFVKYYPIFLVTLFSFILYWKLFIKGEIPMPADLLAGAYYPWLDYNWGYPTGVPVKNPIISDVFSQFFVWKHLAVDQIKNGSWPFWNPYSFSGYPLLATYHSAVFQPFNLVLLILPKYIGWGFFIFLQTFLSAVGIYLYSTVLFKNIFPRFAAAIIFPLSGLMTTWTEFGTGVWAAATLPWILYSVEKFNITYGIKYLLLYTFSLVTLYFSGHVQLTQFITLLLVSYVLFRLINREISKKTIIYTFIFLLLSVGIAAIQFLPTFYYSSQTIRKIDIPVLGINHDGLNDWFEFVRIFAADFYGNPTTYNFWGKGPYHEQSAFLGTIVLPFIFNILKFWKTHKLIKFYFCVFFITLFMAYKNPITEFIYSQKLPLLTYSNASRTLFIFSFAAAILFGYSLELINKLTKKTIYLTSLGLLTFIFILLIYINYTSNNIFTESKTNLPYLKIAIKNSILPSSLLLVNILLVYFLKNKNLLQVILLILILFDLTRYFWKYNTFVPQNIIFPETPITIFLNNQEGVFRIGRVNKQIMPPNTWSHYKLSSAEGYDALIYKDYALYINRLNDRQYNAFTNRYQEIDDINRKYLNSLNVRYLLGITKKENDFKGYEEWIENGYKLAFEDKNSFIIENLDYKPRAYFVQKIEYTSNDNFSNIINLKSFDPSTTALITETFANTSIANTNFITHLANLPNRKILESQGDAGFLIYSENFDKGWSLTVDDVETKIYKTNGSFLGFFVPEGKHKIELNYLPVYFKEGFLISLTSIIILLLVIFYYRFTSIFNLK